MAAEQMTAEQAGNAIDEAYLHGMATKLASRKWPAQDRDQLLKAAQTADRLRAGMATGQIPPKTASANDIFSAGLAATDNIILSNDEDVANKTAAYLLQNDEYLHAGLMAAEAQLAADESAA